MDSILPLTASERGSVMEPDENRLASLFPDVAAQLRAALSNLHLAAAQLAPAEAL